MTFLSLPRREGENTALAVSPGGWMGTKGKGANVLSRTETQKRGPVMTPHIAPQEVGYGT